jgi:hypothetical protein
MSKRPQDTSAEEPDGGNPHIRFRGGPRQGDRPGLLNTRNLFKLATVALVAASTVSLASLPPMCRSPRLTACISPAATLLTTLRILVAGARNFFQRRHHESGCFVSKR